MNKLADRLVITAEERAANARAQMIATAKTLRDRLDPRTLAIESIEMIAQKTQRALGSAGDAARGRPVTSITSLGAFLAAVGLRIWLARRSKPEVDETSRGDAG